MTDTTALITTAPANPVHLPTVHLSAVAHPMVVSVRAAGQVRPEAIDLNPMHWLGDAASAAVGDVWMAAMTGLWSAALWLLKLAFTIIDAFTTPNLSESGPIGSVLPTTLWLGATLAVAMMFVQVTVALIRRDGESIGRVLIGIGQFGLVWAGYLGVAAGLVAAAAGLEKGILRGMLDVNSLSGIDLSTTWPSTIGDVTLATVLGVLSLLIVIPAAFFYVLIMFVREAALIILVVTAPISAGGLVSETGKVWFWKTLRWFFSCLLISPMAALILGIGVKLSAGVINPPVPPKAGGSAAAVANYAAQLDAVQAGMAVVGCIVIAIGACCPLVVFRLLAFIEPGTASGSALRQSWSDAGGLAGLTRGGAQGSGSSAALQSGGDGRSSGEAGAELQTQSRLTGVLGAFGGAVGAGVQVVTSIAHRAADLGSDVLGQTGVGSSGYPGATSDATSRSSGGSRSTAGSAVTSSSGGSAGTGSGDDPDPGAGSGGVPAEPPTPPVPGGGAGAGAAGAGIPTEAAVAVIAL